jgi:hypothetical protein
MSPKAGDGYDAAKVQREDDDLDRWRFAAEIVEVVLATHPDWSARIGIFGRWGEGKSTVLQFAEEVLSAQTDHFTGSEMEKKSVGLLRSK